MDARTFCHRLISTPTLAAKLERPPDDLVYSLNEAANEDALESECPHAPGRPGDLQIAAAREVKVPPIIGMSDRSQRRRIIHALANHELQAIELFAWAVLAFPNTPRAFRRGLIAILVEEQRHFELYCERLADHGTSFGDFGVTGHFWRQLDAMGTPLAFLCAMGLTFENANLDFAGEYAAAAVAAGDQATADALAIVHRDEERHVNFAYRWVTKLKEPSETALQAYQRTIEFPLSISRARGKVFDRDSRIRAGLDIDFIDALENAVARRPSGAPR